MSRSAADRARDVRRVVDAARVVARDRAALVPAIMESTGLSREGVELAFERHLELDPSDADIDSLVAAAGDAKHVVVVLSANVFVAPLRAIALARAASPSVVVRPSRREPCFARALVAAANQAGDAGISIADEVDYARLFGGEIHVYGRDETIAAIRAQAGARIRVRGHGAGMGVAVVTEGADLARAADGLAADVIPFDQRGCLSPLVAIAVGDDARAAAFADALDAALTRGASQVPRGSLADEERRDAAWWLATMAVAGRAIERATHAIAVAPSGAPLRTGVAGRHVHVAPVTSLDAARAAVADWASVITAVGSDDPARASAISPSHARVTALGEMQRPRLDGPVDRRDHGG